MIYCTAGNARLLESVLGVLDELGVFGVFGFSVIRLVGL